MIPAPDQSRPYKGNHVSYSRSFVITKNCSGIRGFLETKNKKENRTENEKERKREEKKRKGHVTGHF